jgi:hypothetical protein
MVLSMGMLSTAAMMSLDEKNEEALVSVSVRGA